LNPGLYFPLPDPLHVLSNSVYDISLSEELSVDVVNSDSYTSHRGFRYFLCDSLLYLEVKIDI